MNELASNIANWRKGKGFITSWDNMPEKLMLVVTELSEAMEAYRDCDICQFNEEIADTFIRLLDICGSLYMDIECEISRKMTINAGRPFRHGRNC